MLHKTRVGPSLAVSIGLFCLLAAPLGQTFADTNASKVAGLTSKAMSEYDLMEFENAKNILEEAIAAGKKDKLSSEEMASAYLHLGIIYFSGFDDVDGASEAFAKSVSINNKIELAVAYRTKEMGELLESVRQEAGSGACGIDGLEHELVDEATAGTAPAIRAKLGEGADGKLTLFYRGEGQLKFAKMVMKDSGNCEFAAKIPRAAVQGDFVHYYIAAVDADGSEGLRKGSAGSPNIIEVAAASGGSIDSNENPLAAGAKSSLLDEDEGGGLFVSFALGTGSGYVSGPTEAAMRPIEKGSFAAAWLHVLPEIGYYFNSQLSVSAAFRAGFTIGATVENHATFAPAGLLRVRYALASDGMGLQLGAAVGAGTIRNTVPIDMSTDVDTTAMGPVLLGAGLGYSFKLSGPARLVAEANALAALSAGFDEFGCSGGGDGCVSPSSGVQFDATLGVLFAF